MVPGRRAEPPTTMSTRPKTKCILSFGARCTVNIILITHEDLRTKLTIPTIHAMGWNIQNRNVQIALGTAATAFVLYKLLKPRKYNFPPGPRGWPVIGNLMGKCIFKKAVLRWHTYLGLDYYHGLITLFVILLSRARKAGSLVKPVTRALTRHYHKTLYPILHT